jgi:glycosyltransferase involved in cell wall biosynthesis
MRVGIDARELMGRPTGVGRYLAELLRAWSDPAIGLSRGHEFLLYGPAVLSAAARALCGTLPVTERVVPGGGGTAWEQTSLRRAVRADRPDVFFAPAYTAPLAIRSPLVVTVHDLSFQAHPEWFSWREGMRRRMITRAAARAAAAVLTDSRFSAEEIQTYHGIPAARIQVIPLGIAPPVAVSAAGAVAAAREPLVLYVGSIFNRRRLPDLVEAFAGLTRRHPQARLLVIGENRTFPRQDLDGIVAGWGVSDRVSIRRYVSDQELAEAYGTASVFAFLSEYEGFGLTPLEALACGIPAVVVDTPVAREVCQEAAVFVGSGDIAGITAALDDLLTNDTRRVAQLDAARRVLAQYSWPEAARATLQAIEGVAR